MIFGSSAMLLSFLHEDAKISATKAIHIFLNVDENERYFMLLDLIKF